MSLLRHLHWGSSTTKRQPAADYSSLPLQRLRPSPPSDNKKSVKGRRKVDSRQHDYSNCCICLCIFFILSIIFSFLYILVLKPIVEAHSRQSTHTTYSNGIPPASGAQDNHLGDNYYSNDSIVDDDQPNAYLILPTLGNFAQPVDPTTNYIKPIEPTINTYTQPSNDLTVNYSQPTGNPSPKFIVSHKWTSSSPVKKQTLIVGIKKDSNFAESQSLLPTTSTSTPTTTDYYTVETGYIGSTTSVSDSVLKSKSEPTSPTVESNHTTVTPTLKPVAIPLPSPSSRESEYDDLFWMRRNRPAGQPNHSHNTYQLVGPRIVDQNDLRQVVKQVDQKEDATAPPLIRSHTSNSIASVKPSDSLINYKEIQQSGLVLESNSDVDIQPVEMTFGVDEEIIDSDKPSPSPSTTGLQSPEEPVWRRLPPKLMNESEPTPPLPPSFLRSFAISATIRTVKKDAAGKKAKQNSKDNKNNKKANPSKTSNKNIVRKRREAPIIVTSLMDIGRGDWSRFTRHFDQYLEYFQNVLRLENYFIIYCEKKVIDFLNTMDGLDWDKLQVVEISLSDLPFYRWKEEIQEIMDEEQLNWSRDWDIQMKTHPEAVYSDYNILVNSKPYFLYNATQISRFNPFKADEQQFFAWVDAGYGHGSVDAIPGNVWSPKHLKSGRITLVKLTTVVERIERYTLEMVYRKQKSVISGGFLAGDISAINRFYTFFVKIFMGMLDEGKVDDDQTTLLATILEYRSTFNILHGGWFDAFKLLSSQ